MSDAGILKNKVAVVVGSTSGIGEAIAREFSAQGAKVVLSGRRTERGQSIVDEILAAGGEAVFIRTDVSVPVDIERLIASSVSRFGALDILVNNAALELTRPLAECTAEDFDRVINTNLRSYFLASVHALKIMTQQRRGVILNVNSVTAEHPAPGIGLYSMAKGAVRQLTRTLALENAHLGIRANEINPGLIQTEIFNDPTAAKVAEFGVSQTPIGRIGTPEECAKAALYLVSDDAGFTTGASLVIDGGLTI
ncbi:glucose 1-dehydrogenase [Sodalis sp. dw_96]|uniref:SDR family NAD(P)-dependent oxidoreductase n=1 Tax=Sodalis sp. dw_96 TaxID=2719794 RepID=UPI001BD441B7|nr:glucose 1-dehydrogenase [Sodalis sp. dw_96]